MRFPIAVLVALACSGCAQWKVSPLMSFRSPGVRLQHTGKNVTVAVLASVRPEERERVEFDRVNRRGAVRHCSRTEERIGYCVEARVGWRF